MPKYTRISVYNEIELHNFRISHKMYSKLFILYEKKIACHITHANVHILSEQISEFVILPKFEIRYTNS